MAPKSQQPGWLSRNQNFVAGAVVASAAGYLAYRAYHSKGLASTQATLQRAAETLQRLGAAAGAAGAVLEQVSADLKAFLESDSDEVPRSLRQLAKLAACPEVQDSIAAAVGAAARGAAPPLTGAALAVVDRLLEVVVSERGSSLVALAVSIAAREGTASLVSSLHQAVLSALAGAAAPVPAAAAPPPPTRARGPAAAAAPPPSSPPPPGLADAAGAAVAGALSLLQSPAGERLMQSVIASGVGGAVGAALDTAAGVDVYGPMLSAFSRPEHRQALTDLAAAMSGAACREMWAAACGYSTASAPGGWVEQGRVVEVEAEAEDAEPGASGRASLPHPCPSPGVPLRAGSRSSSSASLRAAGAGSAAASPPSTPQSGPVTPEPSLLGATLALRQPFSPLDLRRRRGGGAAAGAELQRRQQQQQQRAAGGGAGAAGAGGAGALAAGPGAWFVSLCAHAARHPEIRSLMLDLSASSTREFVRSMLPSFWTGGNGSGAAAGAWAGGGGGGAAAAALALADMRARLQRVQALLLSVVLMALYALTPRAMLLAGASA